ncbi:MAG: restriction endonuclease subunit S [Ignavibacteriales bacterium]|nr:restriction endonuclease subunit S [Ignavibacteriales bacterium]
MSPQISKEIKKYTVETTQANVGIASIKNFVFPLPTLVEQQKIVDELDSKLTACDKIEETIKQALSQSESLRQSILQKAFEGELL